MNASTHVCPPIRRYIFQEPAIALLRRWFQEAGASGIEDVAIAAGFPTVDGDAIVAAVLHPDAERSPGWYEQREGAAWSELYHFGHRYGMYYLLQIHTHPIGYSTRHSRVDDVGAFSDRIGFLSIVVPDFARAGVDLHHPRCTTHERTPSGWRVWSKAETAARLVVIPAALDLQGDKLASRRK